MTSTAAPSSSPGDPPRPGAALVRALDHLLAGLLAVLALLAAGETVAWAIFGKTAAAVEETMGILLVAYGLFGAAWGVARGVHLGLEVGRRSLPARWQAACARLSGLLVATFGGLLAVAGARLAGSVVNLLPATGWSAAVQYWPAAAAGVLIAVFGLIEAIAPHRPAPHGAGHRAGVDA